MSDKVSSGPPPLLAIEGRVTAHFIDGHTLEGEYKAQDTFNIFLIVSDEPVMIPRSQLRFIKGKDPEQIMVDSARPLKSREITAESLIKSEEPLQGEPADGTMISPAASDAKAPQADQEDGTVVLAPSAASEPTNEEVEAAISEEEDGTLVLDIDDLPLEPSSEIVDDDGTFVLPPFGELDDSDQTDVMPSLPETPTEDSDTTIVMPLNKDQSEVTARLSCTSGPHAGDEFTLNTGITTVGRSSDNVIVLSKDKEISRHHAILVQESGRFVVQDQNSLNGTFVNDQQITSPHYLNEGDDILVGLSTLTYHEK